MKPTEILSAEHRVIEQVLNCLEKMVAGAEQTGALEKRPALDAVAFFRAFADECHHGKEEAHLFPAMEARGFPRDGGPTGVMVHEHELGRNHVRGLAAAIEPAAAGDPAALRRFIEHGRGYLDLLRQHIQKEDHCLFPMADQAFTPADQAELLAAFEQVERHHRGAGTHEKFRKMADDLADRFAVARATAAVAGHECCGHH
jgi:hemerythrin-like domain-containing protein